MYCFNMFFSCRAQHIGICSNSEKSSWSSNPDSNSICASRGVGSSLCVIRSEVRWIETETKWYAPGIVNELHPKALYSGLWFTHSHSLTWLLPFKALPNHCGSNLGECLAQGHKDRWGWSGIWTANRCHWTSESWPPPGRVSEVYGLFEVDVSRDNYDMCETIFHGESDCVAVM